MRSTLSQLLAIGPELVAIIVSTPLFGSSGAHALDQNAIPSPDLDLRQLGRVAVAGDFDSISLYNYEGQNEDSLSSNGSHSLLTRYPNGAFQTLGLADANIETMCSYVRDGEFQGVVVGGNFTSLGGAEAASIALFNPDSSTFEELPGINGRVFSVFCDDDSGTVYVGGMFSASNSTNAMAWKGEWSDLPFAGFNGPVNSITKNQAGNIVFGGSFGGLGNTNTTEMSSNSSDSDGQVINLTGGNVTSNQGTDRDGFSDPRNIICKTDDDEGEGNTWLLEDDTPGTWEGEYAFGFVPTRLRLYNTDFEGRGTKTFYFRNTDSGGIMNMSYVDPDGNSQSCMSQCPLTQNTSAQEFLLSPPVGMNSFKIEITDWYGDGGGLGGIELFQDSIFAYAIDEFNEPQCDGFSEEAASSSASPEELWERIPYNVGNSFTNSDYLSARLTEPDQVSDDTNIVFRPKVEESGNYTITIYTPGCQADDTCDSRGEVNLTGTMTSGEQPISTTIYQSNYFDKYDRIYYGYIDAESESFNPSVTLSPLAGQSLPQTIVAQRIMFELVNSTGGLNGLFEYNPNEDSVDTDFSNSNFNRAGSNLDNDALINALESYEDRVYVAGDFSTDGISNIMSVSDNNGTALPNGGLNDNVQTLYIDGSLLYLGGNFTDTAEDSTDGLNNVASFNIDDDVWVALGAGVNGQVTDIVPLILNVTDGQSENCISVNGAFSSVNGFDDNDEFDAEGFAIWVPSRSNWLNNIPEANIAIRGVLSATTQVPDNPPLFAGQISSQLNTVSNAAELIGSEQPELISLGVQLSVGEEPSSSSSSRKRAIDPERNNTGVYTGLFFSESDLNITVLGGQFSAEASNGSTVSNLVFINHTDSDPRITGVSSLESDSIIAAMDTNQNLLFAGGSLSGDIGGNSLNGLIVYDLQTNSIADPHPPPLAGDDVIVNMVATRPSTAEVYVGGTFDNAGSLPCSTLCFYDTEAQRWDTPGMGLSGTIVSMFWSSDNELIIAGDLEIDGNSTTIATYNAQDETFETLSGADGFPGTITALTPATSSYNEFWAAGTSDGSAVLSKYADDSWTGVDGLGPSTVIRGLQLLSVTDDHDSSDLVSDDKILMLTGSIEIPTFGNASAVLYDGSNFRPFLLTNRRDGSQGTLASIFVANPSNLMSQASSSNLAVGFVVLIGLAIALVLTFLLVAVGILLERRRRRREGYVPISGGRQGGNLSRIPPESLLGGLQEKDPAPRI